MKSWQERLSVILPLQRQDNWDARTYGIPRVTARLRLAVSSLFRQQPNLAIKSSEEAARIIRQTKNSGVREILREYSDTEIAFAMRDARK